MGRPRATESHAVHWDHSPSCWPWRPFVAWLEDNHPEDLEVMLGAEVEPDLESFNLVSAGERRPSLTEESTALWSQQIAEFVTEQS